MVRGEWLLRHGDVFWGNDGQMLECWPLIQAFIYSFVHSFVRPFAFWKRWEKKDESNNARLIVGGNYNLSSETQKTMFCFLITRTRIKQKREDE